jgi:cytochrome c2
MNVIHSTWLSLLILGTSVAMAQDPIPLPEDPSYGARLFQEKGCVRCHAIGEAGGRIGPNLGRIHLKGSLLDVAGTMWNHAPAMYENMVALHIDVPKTTPQEMANLVAFLTAYQFYLAQLGKPGDPEKGREIFDQKNCSKCHSLQREADFEKVGPSLRGYAKLSPIVIAQAMWNHGVPMSEEFLKQGVSRPKFEEDQMADLIAYLQHTAAPANADPVYMQPGNPRRGRDLFASKGCAECHPVRGAGGLPEVPDLGKRREELVRSVTQVAGLMWNHGTAMWEKMRERKIAIVKFQDNEMADIIAYLYFINYFDKPGNASSGKELFVKRRCSECHTPAEFGSSAGPHPDKSKAIMSPLDMINAMWNNAEEMVPLMAAKGIPWPKFEPGEMADLVEFLYSHHSPLPSGAPAQQEGTK